MSMHIKKMTFSALIMAMSVLLPQAFHFAGPQSGQVFLPMHIPVLLSGFILGPAYGFSVGLLSPLLSSLISGMPPLARLPFMMLELAAYGFISGGVYNFTRHKKNAIYLYITLIAAMVAGRIVYTISLFVAAELIGITSAGPAAAISAIVTGINGIIIQIVFIPPIVMLLERSGLIDKFVRTGKPVEN